MWQLLKQLQHLIHSARFVASVIVLTGVLVAGVVWFVPSTDTASAQFLIPFEGKITNIEYNCLCSGSIMLTVQPTEATAVSRGAQPVQLLYVWAFDVFDEMLEYFDLNIPLPSAFLWCQLFYPGNQQLVGNYVPGGFPCAAYTGTGCTITGYAQGAILFVGTSLF